MKARIAVTTTLTALFAGVFPAMAADSQLLNLVMPDVKALAGVNVEQAKTTPFGQYILSQLQAQDQNLMKLESLTGFDPTRDVRELLVASNATGEQHKGLFLARGTFDPARIAALASQHGGSSEAYKGVNIIEDPKQTNGVAFLDNTLVIAGDLANVKAAIDRQSVPTILSPSLSVLVSQWSGTQDAWAISAVPPSQLHPPSTAPNIPGMNGQGPFQSIQSAAGGVKFGALVVVSAQVQADTAQNAQSMGDAVKLLANLAMMQSQQDPNVAALAKSLTVSTSGTTLNASVSLPEDQLQSALKTKAHVVRKRPQTRM
jgi:hypothetical protein